MAESNDFLNTMANQMTKFGKVQGSVNLAFAQKIKHNENNIKISQAVSAFAIVLALTALLVSTKRR